MTRKPAKQVQREKDALYTIIDIDNNETVYQTQFMEFPNENGGHLAIDLWVSGSRTHHLYIIDHTDAALRTIWVKLNKVYVNDNPIIPIS